VGVLVGAHLAAALATAAGVILMAVVVIWGRVRGRPARFATDRLILVVLGAVLVGVVLGAALVVGGRVPGDGLHLLYETLALVTLPVARFALPTLTASRRTWALLGGCVVMAGLLIRLAQTG